MALTKISTAMISQSAAAVDLNVDAGTFYVDTTNNRVGVGGKTDPDTPLHVIGTVTATLFAGSGASLTNIPNSALTNSSITINSTATSLGGSITLGTDDVAEGSSNLYYTNARADARIAAATTDDLSEGSSNLYYTDARVDARISGGSLGNITTTGYIRGPSSFTIDPAAHGDNTGTVVIAGNLQVDGTTTTINSTTLTVDDKNITLASGSANAAAANGAGFTVDIGSGTNPAITYDGTNDEWDFNKPTRVSGLTNAGVGFTSTETLVDGSSALANGRIFYHSSHLIYDSPSSGHRFAVAGNQGTNIAMVIDSGQRVGIGTTNPAAPLEVQKAVSGNYVARFQNTNSSTPYGIWIREPTSAANAYPLLQITDSAGTGVHFRVDSGTGNVGIGTGSPATKLNVKHAGNTAVRIETDGDTDANFLQFKTSSGTGQGYIGTEGSTAGANFTGTNAYAFVAGSTSSGTDTQFLSAGAVRVTIDSTGNVGIGTSSTSAVRLTAITATANHIAAQIENSNTADSFGLVVKGGNDANDYTADFRKRDNTNIMRIRGDGNVGIGTTSPAYSLDFAVGNTIRLRHTAAGSAIRVGASDYDVNLIRFDGATGITDNGYYGGALRYMGSRSSNNNSLSIFMDNSTGTEVEAMTILQNGNVGIDNTSPTQKLDVAGRIKSNDGLLSNAFQAYNTNSNGFLIQLDISPSNYAHIHGTIKLQQFNVSSQQIIDFSATTLNNGTLQSYAATADIDVTIKLFVYNSSWYIHVPSPSTYSDISAYIHLGSGYQGGSRGSNCIVGISTTGVPSSGVSGSVDIVAQKRVLANTAGNVGIGTTNPTSAKLDIRTGDIAAGSNFGTRGIKVQLPLVTGYQTQIASIISGFDSAINSTDIGMKYRGGGYDLTFSTNSSTSGSPTQHMVIDRVGNVGIGTINPTSAYTPTLHISGANPNLRLDGTSSNSWAWITANTATAGEGRAFGLGADGSFRITADPDSMDNNVQFFLNQSGNVGIGLSDPDQKLDVNGNIRIPNEGKIVFGSAGASPGDYLELNDVSSSGSLLKLVQDSTTRFVVQGVTGNVGIGLTDPSRQLEIFKAGQAGAYRFKIKGDTGYTGMEIENTSSNNTNILFRNPSYLQELYMDSAGKFHVYNNSLHRFTVDQTGNVGIGAASPYFSLQVQGANSTNGDAKSTVLFFDTTSAAVGTGGGIALGGYTNGTSGDLYHFGNIQGIKENSTAGNYDSAMIFSTRLNGATPTEKVRITSSGNVGIGAASPDYRLHMERGDGSDNVFAIQNTNSTRISEIALVDEGDVKQVRYFYDNGSNRSYQSVNGNGFTVYSAQSSAEIARFGLASNGYTASYFNGNVGIGTSTPQSKLDVKLGNNETASIAGTISTGTYAGLRFGYSEAGNSNYRHSAIVFERDDAAFGDARGNIHILNSPSGSTSADLGDARLTIVPSGNVGIGDTNPQSQLEVNEGSNYRGVHVRGSNAPAFTMAKGASSTPAWRLGISGYDGNDFAISTGSTVGDQMRMDPSGNVMFALGTSDFAPRQNLNNESPSLQTKGPIVSGYSQGSYTSPARNIRDWFVYAGPPTNSHSYVHMKTDLDAGTSSNTKYTMSLFRYHSYYAYGGNTTPGGIIGWHNWSGTLYNVHRVNEGTLQLVQNSYVSSDGNVVLVAQIGAGYAQFSIDWFQWAGYPFREAKVTAVTQHSAATGAY